MGRPVTLNLGWGSKYSYFTKEDIKNLEGKDISIGDVKIGEVEWVNRQGVLRIKLNKNIDDIIRKR